jgi:hypothetical protein
VRMERNEVVIRNHGDFTTISRLKTSNTTATNRQRLPPVENPIGILNVEGTIEGLTTLRDDPIIAKLDDII